MSLRASQIETLRTVEHCHDGATADEVSRHEERWFGSTERSLIRLAELGYLLRSSASKPSNGRQYGLYELTDRGRAALAADKGEAER